MHLMGFPSLVGLRFLFSFIFWVVKHISKSILSFKNEINLPHNAHPLSQKQRTIHLSQNFIWINGAFTLDVKSMLNENLGGILSGTQMLNGQ
jgi:hypothetical protein